MITRKQYKAIEERVEELLKVVKNKTPESDKNFIELDVLSSLLEEYEEQNEVIETPDLPNVLRLRMVQNNLTQVEMAEKLNIPPSRLSQYLAGKAEPTYQIARKIATTFNIDPAIVLGVRVSSNHNHIQAI